MQAYLEGREDKMQWWMHSGGKSMPANGQSGVKNEK